MAGANGRNGDSRRVARKIRNAAARVTVRATNRVRNNDFLSSAVTDVLSALWGAATDAVFLGCVAVCVWIYYQHTRPDNVITLFLKEHLDNSLARWANSNFDKVVAMALFLPVLYRISDKYRYSAGVAIAAAIVVTPVLHVWFYVTSSFVLFFYLTCRRKSTRVTIAFIFACYLYYATNFRKLDLYLTPPSPAPVMPGKNLHNSL